MNVVLPLVKMCVFLYIHKQSEALLPSIAPWVAAVQAAKTVMEDVYYRGRCYFLFFATFMNVKEPKKHQFSASKKVTSTLGHFFSALPTARAFEEKVENVYIWGVRKDEVPSCPHSDPTTPCRQHPGLVPHVPNCLYTTAYNLHIMMTTRYSWRSHGRNPHACPAWPSHPAR